MKTAREQIFATDLLDLERDESTLDAVIDRHTERVVVDLATISTLDVGRMRSLVSLLRRSREHGVDFAVRSAHPDVRRQLALTGLDRILDVDEGSAA